MKISPPSPSARGRIRRRLVHNGKVPFTLAHGAAALPFRRFRLVTSGLVVGTFAPDFEYFLRLAPEGGFGHTLPGTFVLTLPLALLVLWLFHAFVKVPVVKLLPNVIQQRLADHLGEFSFRGAARFALVVGSVLLGIATHLLWDSFTHPNTWPYRHWPLLGQRLLLPVIGLTPVYKVLQHGSTVAGIAVLAVWLTLRYRTTEPSGRILASVPSPRRRMAIIGAVTAIALVGAVVRAALARTGIPHGHAAEERFAGLAIVTAIALVWWQLVAYGVFSSRTIPPAPGADR
jgi:hypothetical protein